MRGQRACALRARALVCLIGRWPGSCSHVGSRQVSFSETLGSRVGASGRALQVEAAYKLSPPVAVQWDPHGKGPAHGLPEPGHREVSPAAGACHSSRSGDTGALGGRENLPSGEEEDARRERGGESGKAAPAASLPESSQQAPNLRIPGCCPAGPRSSAPPPAG